MAITSIFSKFKLYAKSTGASFFQSDELPLLESTELSLPFLEMLLQMRSANSLAGPANGFTSKVKWKVKRGYGARLPGTPVKWDRRGSLEFMSSHYCKEFGSLQFIEDEVKKQIGSVWSAERMAQQFDSVLDNMKQDLYVDIAETIEDTAKRVGTPLMEASESNVPRSIFQGLNEWKTGHGVVADGMFPGVTVMQEYDPTTPGAKMAAHVETYSLVGKTTGSAPGHLFEAFMRGLRNTQYKPYPLAEGMTQGTAPRQKCFASIEGVALAARTLAAHDNVIASETDVNSVYSVTSRMKGLELVDVYDLENIPLCPDYDSNGAPTTAAAGQYVAGLMDQVYFTELTSPYAKGPRFYIPDAQRIRPIWDEECFMMTSPIYSLDETIPDAMVMHVRNDRNLHFEGFRRGVVIRPDSSDRDLGFGQA